MSTSKPKNETGPDEPAFRVYPLDQAINIIRAIAEHRWPISLEEAFALRDQFGWIPAPDDGRFFVTPVSNGEEDGHIETDINNDSFISKVTFRLASFSSSDVDPEVNALMRSVYSECVNELSSIYGNGKTGSSKKVESMTWYLPSRASVYLGIARRLVSATIESPAMTDLTEAEEKYFAEGGDL